MNCEVTELGDYVNSAGERNRTAEEINGDTAKLHLPGRLAAYRVRRRAASDLAKTTTPRARCGYCACAGVAVSLLFGCRADGLRGQDGAHQVGRAGPPGPWGRCGSPGRAGDSPPRCGAPPTRAAAARECAEGPQPLLGSGPAGRAAAAESAAKAGRAGGALGVWPWSGLCFFRLFTAGRRSFSASVGFVGFCRGFFTVGDGERSLLRFVVSLAGHGSAVPVAAAESRASLDTFLVNAQKGCVDKKRWKRGSEEIGVRLTLGREVSGVEKRGRCQICLWMFALRERKNESLGLETQEHNISFLFIVG